MVFATVHCQYHPNPSTIRAICSGAICNGAADERQSDNKFRFGGTSYSLRLRSQIALWTDLLGRLWMYIWKQIDRSKYEYIFDVSQKCYVINITTYKSNYNDNFISFSSSSPQSQSRHQHHDEKNINNNIKGDGSCKQ